MTVQDLIDELQKLDPEMPVFKGDWYYDVMEGVLPCEEIPWNIVSRSKRGKPYILFTMV